MLSFENDYSQGAHEKLLQRLVETNMDAQVGYGFDEYTESAKAKIRQACGCPDAEVYFLVGGTQANLTVIDAALRPHQAALGPVGAHINGHETGAVEATGHKVLALPNVDGKISAAQIEATMQRHYAEDGPEHMVQPGMVYLSFPTEVGTIYSLSELQAIREVCDRYTLSLFVDGARLGYGLCSPMCDVTLPQLAALADVFYIGGTKVGALFGEAVVITNDRFQRDFRYSIKQHGGMLAKGRLLGIQFETLFTDGLYFRIARHAVSQALRIKQVLQEEPDKKHVLFMLDVDNFKNLNDTLGHQAGDNFLIAFAAGIKKCFRESDIVGRVGGDEFFALMKDFTELSKVAGKAEELLDAIQKVCAIYPEVQISGSIGISVYPDDGSYLEDLYAQADAALYKAKRKGKNQYVFASE